MKVTTSLFFPVFLFWAVMMSILVSKEYASYGGSHLETGYAELLSGDFPYRDEWMEIYSADRRIGYISYSVWDRPPSGYEVSAHSVVRLPALQGPVRLESTSIIDTGFKLQEISAKVVVPELLDLTLDGRVSGDELALEIRSGGEVLRMKIDPRRVMFTDLFTPLYALDLGGVKGSKELPVYDPLTGGESKILVAFRGRGFLDIEGRRTGFKEYGVSFRTIECSVFLDKEGRLLFLKGPEEFMVVNELLLGKGAGKELAAQMQSAKCKMQNDKR